MARRQQTNTNIRTGERLNTNVQAARYEAEIDTKSISRADNFLKQLSTAQQGIDMVLQQAGKSKQEAVAALEAQEQAKIDEANQKLKEEQLKQEIIQAKTSVASEKYSLNSAIETRNRQIEADRRRDEAEARRIKKEREQEEEKRLKEMREKAEGDYWQARFNNQSIASFMNSEDPDVRSYAHTQQLNEAVRLANMYADQQVAQNPADAHLRGEWARSELARQVKARGIDQSAVKSEDSEKAFAALMTELDSGNEAKYAYDEAVIAAKKKQDLLIDIQEREAELNRMADSGDYTSYMTKFKELTLIKLTDGDKTPADHIANQMNILTGQVKSGKFPKDQAVMLIDSLLEDAATSSLGSLALEELNETRGIIANLSDSEITSKEKELQREINGLVNSQIPDIAKMSMSAETLEERSMLEAQLEEEIVLRFGPEARPLFKESLKNKNEKDNLAYKKQKNTNDEVDKQLTSLGKYFDKSDKTYQAGITNLSQRMNSQDTIEQKLELASKYDQRVLRDLPKNNFNIDGLLDPVSEGNTDTLKNNFSVVSNLLTKHPELQSIIMENSPNSRVMISELASYRRQKNIAPSKQLTDFQLEELTRKMSPVATNPVELDIINPQIRKGAQNLFKALEESKEIETEEVMFTGVSGALSQAVTLGRKIGDLTTEVKQMVGNQYSSDSNLSGRVLDADTALVSAVTLIDTFVLHDDSIRIPLQVNQDNWEGLMASTDGVREFALQMADTDSTKETIKAILENRTAEDVEFVFDTFDDTLRLKYVDSNNMEKQIIISNYNMEKLTRAYNSREVQLGMLDSRRNELRRIAEARSERAVETLDTMRQNR